LGDSAGSKSDLKASYVLLKEQQQKGKLNEKELNILAPIEVQLNE